MKPEKGKMPFWKDKSYYSDLLPSAGVGLFSGASTPGVTGIAPGTVGGTGNDSEDGRGGDGI